MFKSIKVNIWNAITHWLTHEPDDPGSHPTDYDRMRHELRPADVVLVEGRSRVSEIIKIITLSSWSHAALYIGRLHDIEDKDLREYIQYLYDADLGEPLLVEAILEEGTIIAPLSKYKNFHVRICRPKGLSHQDATEVVRYCIGCVTLRYDIRQLLDLARFMFPYGVLPRRWRSSLFEHNSGLPTQTVCSTMIAQAFLKVNFPVLPLLISNDEADINLQESNTKLFTPRDFDYSPYFEIVKYPMFAVDVQAVYRKLPWLQDDIAPDEEAEQDIQPEPEHQLLAKNESSWRFNLLIKTVIGKLSI